MLHFGVANLRKVPLDKINKLMNEVWEGPGSLRKIFGMVLELRKNSAAREIRFPMIGTKGRSVTADDDDEDDNFPDLPLSSFGLEGEEELEDPEETV